MLLLLRKLRILVLCRVCKWRCSGVWVDCSMGAIPKNSGWRRGLEPLVLIIMMYPCGFVESFLMLCIVFLRLDVSPHNLTNLPFFSGCFWLRLSVVLQCSWGRPVRWSPHCERRTVFCPSRLGLSWSCPWRLGGVHLGGAGHGHIFRISSGRWHMVSVAVVGVFYACIFKYFFNIPWHGYVQPYFLIVPLQCDAAVYCNVPISWYCGNFFFQYPQQVFRVFSSGVFHTKIIYYQGELYWAWDVIPQSWSVFHLIISMGC